MWNVLDSDSGILDNDFFPIQCISNPDIYFSIFFIVFDRIYRVDKSHSRETGGTGLGLSIVKHGALLHNAEIHVESEEGKGTKMELIFHC